MANVRFTSDLNLGGVCQNCPAKTDDALQEIFISETIFFPQMLASGGVGVGENFFPDIRKDCQKIFPDINQY
jgi:hypothetical protein